MSNQTPKTFHPGLINPWLNRLSSLWNSFRIAAWLGWQIESNWTDPFLFATYSIVKPLSGAAILVIMFGVITDGNFNDPIFTYMYIGYAFYIYVTQIMNGIVWAVMDDREHYKTLKYIYTAPVHFPTYLFGRSVAFFIIGSIAVIITLVFGLVFLNVDIVLAQVNWILLVVTVIIGVNMLALMGLIIAGAMLLLVHHMWDLGAAVAGSLFLFCGAIFPLEVLPPAIRWIGYLLPVTYWLELIRRSLVGLIAEAYPTFSSLEDYQLLVILIILTLALAVIAGISFKWCETQARERGFIDMVTNY